MTKQNATATTLYTLNADDEIVTPSWQDDTSASYLFEDLVFEAKLSIIDMDGEPTHTRASRTPRPVVPQWTPDARLINEDCPQSWAWAQLVQTIQSVFSEMFEQGASLADIKSLAFSWIDQLCASDIDDESLTRGTAALQSIIDACWRAERQGVTSWTPTHAGRHHDRQEQPQEDATKGPWFHAQPGFKMHLQAFSRKSGEKTETLLVYREEKRTVLLTSTPKQAKNALKLGKKANEDLQSWCDEQYASHA